MTGHANGVNREDAMHGWGTGTLRSRVKLPPEGVLLAANLVVWVAGAYRVGVLFA
jgi:hypothetical protein